MSAPSPWAAGLRSRCPSCGQGKLFRSYLQLAERCERCAADFRTADSGDGPAFFVILIVGTLVAPLLLVLQFGFDLPEWVPLAITFAVAIALCLWLLPLFKSVLFALQWNRRARQATHEDVT